jgi:outer membrane protein assembly factor BamB
MVNAPSLLLAACQVAHHGAVEVVAPTTTEEHVFFADADDAGGAIAAFRRGPGERVWSRILAGPVRAAVAGVAVVALDAQTGRERWEYADPLWWASLVRTTSGQLCARGVDAHNPALDGHIVCLDSADGEVIWRHDQLGAGTAQLLPLVDCTLLTPTHGGQVELLGPTGALLTAAPLGTLAGPSSDLLLDHDSVWLGRWGGTVTQLSLPDLRREHQFTLDSWVYARPAVLCGELVVLRVDGVATGIDPQTGAAHWSLDLGATDLSAPVLTTADTTIFVGGHGLWAVRPEACAGSMEGR